MLTPGFRNIGAAMIIVFALTAVGSAEESLVTDRPTFTLSARTVGSRVPRFEGGPTFSKDQSGAEEITVGEILARWGVAEKLELRLDPPSYSRERNDDAEDTSFLGLEIGSKYELAEGRGGGVIGGMEAALIAMTTTPTSSSDFASSKWQPSAILAAGWELGPNVGIGSNLGVGRPADDHNRFTSLWASVALSLGMSDAASIFDDIYDFNREEPNGPTSGTLQTGFVYLVDPDFQHDVRAGRRLTDQGVDVLFGAGLSWRLGG